jgi:hypothetical protein
VDQVITKKARSTDMMKMFGVVRDFLDRYYKATRSDRFHRPKFADNIQSLWYGLTEDERNKVLVLARRDDFVAFEEMLLSIDEENEKNEENN